MNGKAAPQKKNLSATQAGIIDAAGAESLLQKLRREGGEDADLRGADLSGQQLKDISLSGAKLTGANLQGTKLNGCSLDSADLTGSQLAKASISGAYAFEAC